MLLVMVIFAALPPRAMFCGPAPGRRNMVVTPEVHRETEVEAEVRKRICHTCENLGLTVQAANTMADKAISNLRTARKHTLAASAHKGLVSIARSQSSEE
jgi:hypothetical protein